MMEKVCEDIWSVPAPLTVLGFIKLNTRMTIVRMRDDSLWLHSPVPLTEQLRQAVSDLGDVQYIVAPSSFHHMFVQPWKEAFPNAKLYIARGLDKKRKDLEYTGVLEGGGVWPEFAQCTIKGMPVVNEELFFHRDSQTLIVTDFLFFMPQSTGFTGLYAWINGFKQRVTTPLLFKSLIKDKEAFRDSLHTIRGWHPQNISMCHHSVCKENADEVLQGALDRLGVAP